MWEKQKLNAEQKTLCEWVKKKPANTSILGDINFWESVWNFSDVITGVGRPQQKPLCGFIFFNHIQHDYEEQQAYQLKLTHTHTTEGTGWPSVGRERPDRIPIAFACFVRLIFSLSLIYYYYWTNSYLIIAFSCAVVIWAKYLDGVYGCKCVGVACSAERCGRVLWA